MVFEVVKSWGLLGDVVKNMIRGFRVGSNSYLVMEGRAGDCGEWSVMRGWTVIMDDPCPGQTRKD